MNWKEFLKPDLKKIILLLVLLYFSSAISYRGSECISPEGSIIKGISCSNNQGFPFAYYSGYQSMSGSGMPTITSYNYYALIPDIIFWHIISSAIVFLFYKNSKGNKS